MMDLDKFNEIIESVPDYKEFLTVDELKVNLETLAEKNKHVEIFKAGVSTEGEDIHCLKMGNGPRNALLFGFPHPNEPVGSMTLEYFTERLAEDDELRETLGYTWYIIKCVDPDGARLNEGWFKKEFTPLTYALNYYRPPGKNQVEWTFPIDYKTLHFHNPLPETQALIKIIDEVKPQFLYSLHNAGFCGIYWYISEPTPEVYPKLYNIVREQSLPLHRGEPETPHIEKLDEAIFKMFGAESWYDFTEKHSDVDPATLREHGTSSHGYLRSVCDGFTLLCEMPYYYDDRITDNSPSETKRREAILNAIRRNEEDYRYLHPRFQEIKGKVNESSRLYASVYDYLENFEKRNAPRRSHAETSPDYEGEATVAQEFDSRVSTKFYSMLRMGMALRVIEQTIAEGAAPKFHKIREEIHVRLLETNDMIMREADIKVIPIQKLVRIQVGSGLLIAEHLRGF